MKDKQSPPGVKWISSDKPPRDGWFGMVYGRYANSVSESLHIFNCAHFSKVNGWRFEATVNNGTSGGFNSYQTTTVRHALVAMSWLAIGDEAIVKSNLKKC